MLFKNHDISFAIQDIAWAALCCSSASCVVVARKDSSSIEFLKDYSINQYFRDYDINFAYQDVAWASLHFSDADCVVLTEPSYNKFSSASILPVLTGTVAPIRRRIEYDLGVVLNNQRTANAQIGVEENLLVIPTPYKNLVASPKSAANITVHLNDTANDFFITTEATTIPVLLEYSLDNLVRCEEDLVVIQDVDWSHVYLVIDTIINILTSSGWVDVTDNVKKRESSSFASTQLLVKQIDNSWM